MFAVGVTVGIASAIVTGTVYGVATVLESGLEAGLRAALVNGTVNGIGAGWPSASCRLRYTVHGRPPGIRCVAPAGRQAFHRALADDRDGLVIGAGYRLVLGPVAGLAAGLMAAAGAGTMTAWGRWLVLARIWPPSRQAAGKQ